MLAELRVTPVGTGVPFASSRICSRSSPRVICILIELSLDDRAGAEGEMAGSLQHLRGPRPQRPAAEAVRADAAQL